MYVKKRKIGKLHKENLICYLALGERVKKDTIYDVIKRKIY